MRIMLRRHPRIRAFLLTLIIGVSHINFQSLHAEVITMPIHRAIPTQPITTLEVVALIKTILSGRVLAVKKSSTYSNPDCHHVKFLEDKGEFQMINVGCFVDNIVQNP